MKKQILVTSLVILLISAAVVSGLLVIKSFSQTSQASLPIGFDAGLTDSGLLPKFEKPQPIVSFLAVGDIMLSRSVEQLMVKQNNFTLPFAPLAKLTSSADLTFGNLETAIIAGRPIVTGEFSFRTDPKAISGLKLGGFDVLSLANNHTPNFGQAGLVSTFAELNKADIAFVGAGLNAAAAQKPVILEKQGIKFGFLAYTYAVMPESYQASDTLAGTNFMDLENLKKAVGDLKKQVDFVIVSMHAGTEYVPKPNSEQTEFARTAIDAGAALVIGHHPHVVQSIEKYHGGYIFYSLGNFIFDQHWSVPTQQGMMVKINFLPQQIKDIEFLPVRINNDFAPTLALGQEEQDIIGRLGADLTVAPKFFYNQNNLAEEKSWWISNSDLRQKNDFSTADLDNDGNVEQAIVVNGAGYISSGNNVLWRSNSNWTVHSVSAGDFNNDGQPEFGFALWKEGSFGSSLPFWLKQNDSEVSDHLFLYGLKNGKIRQVWGSSAIDQPIREMKVADIDSDGKNELIVLEGSLAGKVTSTAPTADVAVWKWYGFNFFKQAQSRPGNFFDLGANLNYIDIKETK